MEKEKEIFIVRPGQQLVVECFEDSETHEHYLLVRDEKYKATRAQEILAGNTIYTSDQRVRIITLDEGCFMELDEFRKLNKGNPYLLYKIPINAPLPPRGPKPE